MKTLFNRDSIVSIVGTIELVDVVHSTNCFSANGWSYEVAEKYLFKVAGNVIEAGFYTHYADEKMDKLIKRVIELPTSYGCPMNCVYCASSFIDDISSLSAEILSEITDVLMDAHEISDENDVLVALTGTGDAYYTLEVIREYISIASQKYTNLCFTISSCNWTKEMLKIAEDLSSDYNFRNIQFTFISLNEKLVRRLIPGLQHIEYRISDLLEHIAKSSLRNWRINYLMIKSINDGDDNFSEFVKAVQPLKEKVIVRISSLNETIASNENGLKPSKIQRSEVLQNLLKQNGINAYLFFSERNDNMSCGQLVLENLLNENKIPN